MPKYTLYSYGQHYLEPPISSSPSPCHPSSTLEKPCLHTKESSTTQKSTFCPLALQHIRHFNSSNLIRILTPSGSLIQDGHKLWYTPAWFDTQFTFYSGRVRPQPGTPLFGQNPQVAGRSLVQCDLLEQGHDIIGVATGGGQSQPSVVLFSNGELRVLRYTIANDQDVDGSSGSFALDKLNETEMQALDSVGNMSGIHNFVGLAQTIAPGPISLLLKTGIVIELPWKDMTYAKQHPGGRKELRNEIVEITAGDEAIVARTVDGEVWFWRVGQNAIRVKMGNGKKAKAIRAGGKMGIALTDDGEVWAWRLSRPDFGEETKIIAGSGSTWIASPEGVVEAGRLYLAAGNTVDASVGGKHLAAKGANGRWYMAGDGRYGQLGIGDKVFEIDDNADVERGDEFVRHLMPMNVPGGEEEKIEAVVCGGSMTWIIIVAGSQ